ncbi:MAG: FAD binding domain-containing protein [Actinomycetota bacterium]|nr:FAD binding domain-containing protein [Actinomycetota bacterium]
MHEVQDRTWAVDRYERPATLDEAVALLDRHDMDARIIAGGTDLLLELQRKVRSIEVLIDLSAIPNLNEIKLVDGRISLGPLVTHKDIVSSKLMISAGLPLAQASLEVGSAQLRNRATVAGNVVTASPANDTISALLALDATVHLASARGERSIAIRNFYLGVRRTVMESNELVTSISFPELTTADRGIFAKIGLRSAQAISVVHGAVVITETDGVVTDARIALGSVAPVVILTNAAQILIGNPLTADRIKECATAAAAEVTPISDGRATAEYRTSIVEVAVARMLTSLLDGTERSMWPKRVTTLDNAQSPSTVSPVSVGETDTMQMTINGVPVEGSAQCDTTLLDWIRENATGPDGAALTGTKEGCAEGECGACTVHMDGKAVLACLVAAPAASGSSVLTIEGLASERDVAIQRTFVDLGAVQCGYCTPGFVMSASSLVSEHHHLAPHEIRDGLSGNICRCTGYESLVESLVQISNNRSQDAGGGQ